jgi:hypothetical protein
MYSIEITDKDDQFVRALPTRYESQDRAIAVAKRLYKEEGFGVRVVDDKGMSVWSINVVNEYLYGE